MYGDLDVPANYVTEDGIKLGKWIANLRHARKKQTDVRTKLTPERIAMLDTIGMQWAKPTAKAKTVRLSREEQWESRLECVKAYQKKYGDLNIPAKYKRMRASGWADGGICRKTAAGGTGKAEAGTG